MRHFDLACLLSGSIFLCGTLFGSETTGETTARPQPAISKEIMALLDNWMGAVNKLDIEEWERTMHFPHYRLAGGKMIVRERPGQLKLETLKRGLGAEWHHSKWERRTILNASESKVHVDTRFARCRQDGSVIASYDSLLIITNERGRWGIKMRSSFAP